ncbi:hypothetical protein SAMN04487949_3208 [Halogranum gelatinilyticum]|uniref:Peptidase family M23 n=1 Tax=Halogranum gelatinilyticum TaxID=660521 RepID=A0A1G9Y0A7_9EURY|nr:hypothetical protein [Halogranum gelatinilyticum]SDN02478.1 hypothetical protein SAMN04487949_3208 [Halogranum gelatinilyticum]
MAVTLPAEVLERYRRFSLYNSPYPAHDHGCAVDLYPETNDGLSPVAGEVLATKTVRCPDQPYAVDHDHLIVIDCGDVVARILHVEPAVEPGDVVAVGDSLGPMVRSGFFGQWVDNHVHLGFREPGQNYLRAGGSLPVEADVTVEPLDWDGTGEVVAVGETYAVLDAPTHPAPGDYFAGITADDGAVLDGGLTHYTGGGILTATTGPVSFLGTQVGVADGRDVTWDDVEVLANGERVVGLSLFAAQDSGFGAKLVAFDHDFAVGDAVEVTVRPTDDPVRLG